MKKNLLILGVLFLFSLGMVSAAQCDDGVDNDGDGDIDYGSDATCTSSGMGPEGITITYGNDGDSCSSDSDCTEYGFSCDTSQRKCVTSCNDREDNDGDAGIDSFGACYAGGGYFSCSQIGVDSTDYGSLTAYREACEKECEPQINVFGSTVSATYVEYDFKCGFDPYGAGSESGCSIDIDSDGDGLVDGYGACDSGTDGYADVACPSAITKVSVCRRYCSEEGYTYVAVGGSCAASPSPAAAPSLEIEEEESFWQKVWNFLFDSEAAENRFLDRSYARK